MLNILLIASQLLFTIIIGLYFVTVIRTQQNSKTTPDIDSRHELEQLRKLRSVELNKPLSEKTRPTDFSGIIGQQQGVKALCAALCGPNPQHVLIYGPPGVGKTAAARLALANAKASPQSPFMESAPFVELDATILQFDERSIADPLIGSVHDPIYQGAGAYGHLGVPQPKQGAVTAAHGGVLFIDEIGELHPMQMNRLLKVLEDRRVLLSSSYYSRNNKNIPQHIHDIFKNGFPADFRLIGATTRQPEELPDALRSRCTEVFFRRLSSPEIMKIAANACANVGFACEENVPALISQYCANGRDAVNIVQTTASVARLNKRTEIILADVEEVIESGRHTPNLLNRRIASGQKIGVVNGLAVLGYSCGMLLEVEAVVSPVDGRRDGRLRVTGIIEEEDLNGSHGKLRRQSSSKTSVMNVLTAMERFTGIRLDGYDIHLNFPGGFPVDGPSAGAAIYAALYSALCEKPVPGTIAVTGEISIKGRICPVGGIQAKVEAAIESGIEKILIPKENYRESFERCGVEIIGVDTLQALTLEVFRETAKAADKNGAGSVRFA